MATRTVNISLVEQVPQERKLYFIPVLTSLDGDLLLEEQYNVTTDENGEGTIDLPVKDTGNLRYNYEVPGDDGVSLGYFLLSAGGEIDLDELIAAGGVASDSVKDYVDAQIAEALADVAELVSDDAYDEADWNGVTDVAPSKNAVRDKVEALIAYIDSQISGSNKWCLEFDGEPMSVELGVFYAADVLLGNAFYECYAKIAPGGGSGHYDWSDGYGGAHGMLRSSVSGNFLIGAGVSNATNASPIVITTEQAHPFQTGDAITIAGVLGNTAANVTATAIIRLSSTSFSINGTTGNGAYTSGGVASGPASFGGTGVVSFSADDIPYDDQWHHSAVGVDVDRGIVVMYYDGVPAGATEFTGNRCAGRGGLYHGFIGGSDHSNFKGCLLQYRIFEGSNPRAIIIGINTNIPLTAFTPDGTFGSQFNGKTADFLADLSRACLQIADLSRGYPSGDVHTGRLKGQLAGAGQPYSSGATPAFVTDATIPDFTEAGDIQPAGKTYTPASVPSGALVFDSIQRKNSTYAFNKTGGMGSTEGGSLGVLAWQQPDVLYTGSSGIKPFGILNEQFVYLADGNDYVARVAIGSTDLDIRVSRKASSSAGAGISTGIAFRYIDDSNFCFAVTKGATRTGQTLILGQMVAGVATAWTGNGTALPASSWEVLRVTTKSTGVYAVYADATSVVSGTNAQHAAGTGAGITSAGDPANYSAEHSGAGLRLRYRNFTVFANP